MKSLRLLLVSLGVALLAGCHVLTPKAVVPVTVERRQASWDGANQNSGLLGSWIHRVYKDDKGHVLPRPAWLPPDYPDSFFVTPHFRDRYNDLIATYGDDFPVPLTTDAGLQQLTPDIWAIDPEHLSKAIQMARNKHSAIAPAKK